MFPKNLQKSFKEHIICQKCSMLLQSEKYKGSSLRDISKLEVGFTDIGIQIWCPVHQVNVCHIDFGGNRLQSDFRCIEPKKTH